MNWNQNGSLLFLEVKLGTKFGKMGRLGLTPFYFLNHATFFNRVFNFIFDLLVVWVEKQNHLSYQHADCKGSTAWQLGSVNSRATAYNNCLEGVRPTLPWNIIDRQTTLWWLTEARKTCCSILHFPTALCCRIFCFQGCWLFCKFLFQLQINVQNSWGALYSLERKLKMYEL